MKIMYTSGRLLKKYLNSSLHHFLRKQPFVSELVLSRLAEGFTYLKISFIRASSHPEGKTRDLQSSLGSEQFVRSIVSFLTPMSTYMQMLGTSYCK